MPLTIDEQARAARDPRRARLYAARERRNNAQAARNRAREALRTAEEMGDAEAMEQARAEIADADAEITLAQQLQENVLRQLAGEPGLEGRYGQALANNAEAQAVLAELARSSAPIRANVPIGQLMSAEEACGLTGRAINGDSWSPVRMAAASGIDAGGSFVGMGMAPPQAPLTLLDLFPSATMTGRKEDFLQRQGGIANADVQVPGAIKAEAGLEYAAKEVEAATVATWVKLARQDIADVDGLLSDVQIALNYGVLFKVESLLVNGAAGIEGILSSTGTLAPDLTGLTFIVDKISRAIAELALTGVQPNFVAYNPLDAHAARIARTTGSGDYNGDSPIPANVARVESAALPQGTALVGNSVGARLRVREGVSLTVGQESEDPKRNMATVLVEGRWTPQVDAPSAFAVVDLS